ncbi:MAG TPA: three-Cys-motif partner protein TcmP [Kofleriaceae bacterium]|nr:three-Cys-motif partner protein TcmP [Kofleriaceae bacterium]
MPAPKTTLWPLEPHTRAKHEILRRYLEAWTAILSLGKFPRIAYVDGFAGPGVYAGGESGSPIIALEAALQHKDRIPPTTVLLFLFIEKDEDRADHLRSLVGTMDLPKNFHTKIVSATFEEGFQTHLLHFYAKDERPLPPTFAFIDPFGWSQTPFELVKTILSFPSCEVLINFMYEEVNRFVSHPHHPATFDRLFGTERWREVLELEDKHARRALLHDLYVRQLREAAGARYVRSFEMRNDKDVTDYFLFFATNSRKGIQKMKEAMWRVDQSGEFRFSDATNQAQLLLFSPQPDFEKLAQAICARFASREVTVNEIEDFVLAETPFHETQYKRNVLTKLEDRGVITAVSPPAKRRRGAFPPELRLRFSS